MDPSKKEITSESISDLNYIIGKIESIGKKWYKSKILWVAFILTAYSVYQSYNSGDFTVENTFNTAIGILMMVFRLFACDTKLKK